MTEALIRSLTWNISWQDENHGAIHSVFSPTMSASG